MGFIFINIARFKWPFLLPYRLRKFWRFGLTEGSSSASIRASAKSAMSSEKNAILRKKSLIQSDPKIWFLETQRSKKLEAMWGEPGNDSECRLNSLCQFVHLHLLSIRWSIDPIITLYKPTEAVPLNPLQRASMYLATVRPPPRAYIFSFP